MDSRDIGFRDIGSRDIGATPPRSQYSLKLWGLAPHIFGPQNPARVLANVHKLETATVYLLGAET